MGDVSSSGKALFGPFELDFGSGELRKRGRKVRLPEQAVRILSMLVGRPGELVTRQEIQNVLWPNGTQVEFEHSINAAIKKLRLALGDSAEAPRYVETVARRGYRLIAAVERLPLKPERESDYRQDTAVVGNLSGRRISHYRILNILGGGAMGLVYLAEDLKLGRRVALKFLPDELTKDPLAVERLKREACAASALTHPNICTVHAIEEEGGHPFIVMELLEGANLRDRIAQAPLGIHAAIEFGIQIADALKGAHRHGIIHRDIKTANIFITDRQQAKILDFGVAKLAHDAGSFEVLETVAAGAGLGGEHTIRADLTRTGEAVGTAAYMSPEQVRGQKLDCRTDLFSFGLVLYEMATGRQAFEQFTVSLLHDAILNRSPVPVREVNPQAPVELVKIIEKAIRKDRGSRYQSAGEMLDDLIRLRERGSRKWRSGRYSFVTTAASVILTIAIAAVILRWHPAPANPRINELKQRKLTSNSSDNPIRGGGRISPDGKYLAYADRLGIHLQLIETGETRTIPRPEGFDPRNSYWSIGGWFPSSKMFLVGGRPAAQDAKQWSAEGASIWTVSFDGPPHKIRDNGEPWSVSPDGGWIAFGARAGEIGDREIWLMRPNGEQAHKLFGTSDERMIEALQWTPDGRHVMYADCDKDICNIVTRDLNGSPPIVVSTWPEEGIILMLWLSDGRLLYIIPEPGPSVASCNLWQQRVDTRNGHALDRPTRLTNWAGFCLDALSASADSKRVAFTHWANQTNILIGDLAVAGRAGFAPVPMTMGEGWNTFLDWTGDSKAILFTSDRNGKWEIFRQPVSGNYAQPIIRPPSWAIPTEGFFTGIAGGALGVQTSPDGRWILYFANPAGKSVALMRVPAGGGPPERVSDASAGATLGCSKTMAGFCVIAERTPDQNQIVFTAVNPSGGRGAELGRIAAGPEPHPWALSHDGSTIAVHSERSNHFDLISTTAAVRKSLEVQGWSAAGPVSWSAKDDGLFASALSGPDALVVYVGLNGKTRVIWRQTGDYGLTATPSPDSRLLALTQWRNSSNVWMIDDF